MQQNVFEKQESKALFMENRLNKSVTEFSINFLPFQIFQNISECKLKHLIMISSILLGELFWDLSYELLNIFRYWDIYSEYLGNMIPCHSELNLANGT